VTELPNTAETNTIYGQAFNDAGLPGRLFRGTKRLLGSATTQRVMVFQKPFRLVALITPILLRIRKTISRKLMDLALDSEAAQAACLGHPVNFEGRDADHNNIALNRLSEAYAYAGIRKQSYYPEPTAATQSYLYANPFDTRNLILTVDFGGGTLDFSVLKRRESEFDVIGIHGVALGGDHIDQCLFRSIFFRSWGKASVGDALLRATK